MTDDANVTITKAVPDDGDVQLYDPVYEGFSYGQGNAGSTIDFGVRGGFEPRVWIGPRDHPLLPGLLTARPDLIEGDGKDELKKVIVCPECFREFNSLLGFKNHVRTHRPAVVGG